MDEARLIREYFDTLAWPMVVLVLVGLFLWLFRPDVADLIRRIRQVRGPGGTAVDVAPHQAAVSLGSPEARANPEISELISEKEQQLNLAQQSAEALRQWAGLYYVYWQFEKVYRLIWGSQIDLLQFLVPVNATGANLDTIATFHLEHERKARTLDPSYNYPLQSYVGFLTATELAEVRDGRYFISDVGKGFLQWMISEGLSAAAKPW